MTQYIRKGRKYLKKTETLDEDGKRIPKSGKRSKGFKKGVMVAGVDENGGVVLGFSLCHSNDRFDYHDSERVGNVIYAGGKKAAGFGKDLAIKRALKWKNYPTIIATQSQEESIKDVVLLPKSIEEDFVKFCMRAIRYYKDREFPPWVQQNDQPL